MLAIGRTLMTQADVLILDEPCEGIAPILVLAIARALAALKSQGYTFLIAEQNQILTGLADKELTLSGGVIQD